MSIRAVCVCGKELRVKDEHADKRVKCPACGEKLTVPQAASEFSPPGTYGLTQDDDQDRKPKRKKKRPPSDTEDVEFDITGHALPPKKRKSTAASTGRTLLAVPLFILAIGSALATGLLAGLPLVLYGISLIAGSPEADEFKGMYIVAFAVGGVVTTALFWVASSVKQGRFIPFDEFFMVGKDH